MPPPGHIPETVAPGWALTITSADFGVLGAVTETPPAGFGCASSDLDDGEVQATGQQVRFTLQGDSPSPYIVNTPSQEGVYHFSGMLRDSDRKDTPAGGTSWGRATVPQPSNPGPLCAQRTTRPPFLSRRRPFSLGPAAGPPLSLTTTVLPEHLVRSGDVVFMIDMVDGMAELVPAFAHDIFNGWSPMRWQYRLSEPRWRCRS